MQPEIEAVARCGEMCQPARGARPGAFSRDGCGERCIRAGWRRPEGRATALHGWARSLAQRPAPAAGGVLNAASADSPQGCHTRLVALAGFSDRRAATGRAAKTVAACGDEAETVAVRLSTNLTRAIGLVLRLSTDIHGGGARPLARRPTAFVAQAETRGALAPTAAPLLSFLALSTAGRDLLPSEEGRQAGNGRGCQAGQELTTGGTSGEQPRETVKGDVAHGAPPGNLGDGRVMSPMHHCTSGKTLPRIDLAPPRCYPCQQLVNG